jgi:hypothetical protein
MLSLEQGYLALATYAQRTTVTVKPTIGLCQHFL